MVAPLLAVGCPVRSRAWILDRWFQHTVDACDSAGVEATFVFAVDERDESFPIIDRWSRHVDVEVTELHEDGPADRNWNNRDRLEHMVDVRNRLLGLVRELGAGLFWSLDSDILVPPLALRSALNYLNDRGLDGVATLTWMVSTGFEWPNFGQWSPSHGGLLRFPARPGIQLPAQIIMAAKLLGPRAFGVDYRLQPIDPNAGEDIGWSLAAGAAGCQFGVDGSHPAKHVMGVDMLDAVDRRVGW